MTSQFTISLSGDSKSTLQVNFLPEILLDTECEYSCALLDLFIMNSTNLTNIINLGEIHIDCDIIFGTYINGQRSHTIHQFVTSASHVKEQTLVEIPKHLNYFPIKAKSLRSIQIVIRKKNGEPANVTGSIICRINIRKEINKKST